MAGLFDAPKQTVLPTPDPAQTQNRINDALARQLQAGGTNADQVGPSGGLGLMQSAPRQATLTGLN